jgi:hypothetical protein
MVIGSEWCDHQQPHHRTGEEQVPASLEDRCLTPMVDESVGDEQPGDEVGQVGHDRERESGCVPPGGDLNGRPDEPERDENRATPADRPPEEQSQWRHEQVELHLHLE